MSTQAPVARHATFSSAEERDNNFDFLRFVLAVSIIAYHSFPLLRGVETANYCASVGERIVTTLGGFAVPFFFVISGFLITKSWLRNPNVLSFLKKRALRIFPAFVVASLFCVLVVGPLGATHVSLYWRHFKWLKFFAYLFLLPNDVAGPDLSLVFAHSPLPNQINGSIWTLRYEFACYFLVALFGLLGLFDSNRRKGRLIAAFALLFLFYALHVLSWLSIVPNQFLPRLGNPMTWLRSLTFFGAGLMCCLFRERIPFRSRWLQLSLALLVVAAALSSPWLAVLMPVFGSYALLYTAFDRKLAMHNFGRYGDFSYGIYLYAFPIQQLLVQRFAARLTPLTLFCAAFPLALLCGVLSWHLVEKPCLKLVRHAMARPALGESS